MQATIGIVDKGLECTILKPCYQLRRYQGGLRFSFATAHGPPTPSTLILE